MSPVLRPLRADSTISDPDLALGARLLRHAQPWGKSEARKRRVWNTLSSGGSSRIGFRLRALHVAFASVSVLVAAASSAAVGHYYVQQHNAEANQGEADTGTRAAQPGQARAAKRRPSVPAQPAPVAEPASPATTTSEELTSLPHAPSARPKPDAAARRSAVRDADAELLVEAMRARRGGDAKRVSELTSAYLAKHPQGALQEEALILSIESAATRHAPNTGAFAREYLTRYPNGRFAAQAQRALGNGAR